MNSLFEQIQKCRVYDLGQPYFAGMPHYPTHPPFLFGLTKKHGDMVSPDKMSSAADSIALGTHVGTHIDALCHVSCGGKLHGGVDAEANQNATAGMKKLGIDTVPPILRRGVLLDIAAGESTARLPVNFSIRAEHLERAVERQKVTIVRGDVVLLRTGWGALWNEIRDAQSSPGPERDGAEWLSARGIFAAGSDTIAFEKVPSGLPVHVHLLVESGIHIIEALNLEELAADRIYEFLFIGVPMKIRGATGAPVRPLALASGI